MIDTLLVVNNDPWYSCLSTFCSILVLLVKSITSCPGPNNLTGYQRQEKPSAASLLRQFPPSRLGSIRAIKLHSDPLHVMEINSAEYWLSWLTLAFPNRGIPAELLMVEHRHQLQIKGCIDPLPPPDNRSAAKCVENLPSSCAPDKPPSQLVAKRYLR